MGPPADEGGEQVLITDSFQTENTVDTEVHRRTLWERESSEFKRNLNGGPQADGGGERQLENNKYPQMSQMDTDLEPVARIIND